MISLELIQNSFRPNLKFPIIGILNGFLESNIIYSLLDISIYKGNSISRFLVKNVKGWHDAARRVALFVVCWSIPPAAAELGNHGTKCVLSNLDYFVISLASYDWLKVID